MTFKDKTQTASDLLSEAIRYIDKAYDILDFSTDERDNIGTIRKILISHAQPQIGYVFDLCTNVRDMLENLDNSIGDIEDEAERRAEIIAESWDR